MQISKGLPNDPKSPQFIDQFAAFLITNKFLDELAVRRAQRAQSQTGERFDLVLVRLGLLTDVGIADALARYCGLRLVGEREFPESPVLTDRLNYAFLKTNRMLPLAAHVDRIEIAVADPFCGEALDGLSYLLGLPVEPVLASEGEIERALERQFGNTAPKHDPVAVAIQPATDDTSDEDVRRLADMASEAPVIRLVQDLIVRAVELLASDIHVEPREDSVHIRFRIDGVLHAAETLNRSLRSAVCSRLKIMAQMNIAERRLPQDGRIKVNVRGREIDLRVSTMPTLWGESLVLRILDRSSIELDFHKLGFSGPGYDAFAALMEQPNGIILVTGPTGSGKTTTLYTALSTLNTPERKVFTVEDPIEYQMPGINQIQVHPKIGLTFAAALRSILRQDPDIIMVGEIRDLETAQIAIQASLTGHLVLSTVHTNNAAATVTRLLDMGVEKYLLASCLKGVLAQRLVRRVCEMCAVEVQDLSPVLSIGRAAGIDLLAALGSDRPQLRRGAGCPACRQKGFAGRTTIYELLTTTNPVREAILAARSEREMEDIGKADGMTSLLHNGLVKALRGETTPEEVLRVTRFDECQSMPIGPTTATALSAPVS